MNRYLSQIYNPVLPDNLGGNVNTDINRGTVNIGNIIGALIGFMVIVAFVLAIFYLINGAFAWITSGGDKSKLQAARDKIVHALLGLIVVFAIWGIMNIVGPFLGIDFPNLPFPTLESVVGS